MHIFTVYSIANGTKTGKNIAHYDISWFFLFNIDD